MRIHTFSAAFLVFLAALTCTQANAGAYKCLSPNGKVEYRDSPCATTQKVEKTFSQELSPAASSAPRANDSSVASSKEVQPTAGSEQAPAAAGGQKALDPKTPASQRILVSESEPSMISGGACSGNLSWDTCRKLGIESIVDCKRMDEDLVFRASVLQSKGVQCPRHSGRH